MLCNMIIEVHPVTSHQSHYLLVRKQIIVSARTQVEGIMQEQEEEEAWVLGAILASVGHINTLLGGPLKLAQGPPVNKKLLKLKPVLIKNSEDLGRWDIRMNLICEIGDFTT